MGVKSQFRISYVCYGTFGVQPGFCTLLYLPLAFPCVAPVFIGQLVAPNLKMGRVSSVQKKDKMADGSLFPSLLRRGTFLNLCITDIPCQAS